jgi:hypothetical protein
MRPEQVFVANLVAILLAATLVGVVATGRIWLCRSFGLYLALTLATNRMVTWWPEHFYTHGFWAAKELLQALLVVAVAVELALVGFSAFPRVRRIAVLAVVTVSTLATIGIGAGPMGDYRAWVGSVVARAAVGAVWSMALVVLVAYRYGLPLASWHRMLAMGFVLNHGVYALLLGAVGYFGWSAYGYLSALDPAAYAASVGLWTFGSWRTDWRDIWVRTQGRLRDESRP